MFQDDTCKIISQSDHPFQMLLICLILGEALRFRVKILAASDTESDCAIQYTWVVTPSVQVRTAHENRSPERDQHIRAG